MKVSALAAGSVASGDPPATPPPAPIFSAILHCVARRAFKGPSGGMRTSGTGLPEGLCDLGGQLGLSVLITCLQDAWAKVCINMLVPGCLPSPTLFVLPHVLAAVSSAYRQRASSGQWGARAGCAVTSIHSSLAPGREWELVLQSGQVEAALTAEEPCGHYHLLCDSRARLSLGIEAGAPRQNLHPGPPAPCPCWRC